MDYQKNLKYFKKSLAYFGKRGIMLPVMRCRNKERSAACSHERSVIYYIIILGGATHG